MRAALERDEARDPQVRGAIRSGRVACASLLLLAFGCSQTRVMEGSPLLADPRESIAAGVTTRGQVLELFGAPSRVLRSTRGEIWNYRYRSSEADALSLRDPLVTRLTLLYYRIQLERSEELTVFFDPAGVVTEFGYRPLSDRPRGEEEAPVDARAAPEPAERARLQSP